MTTLSHLSPDVLEVVRDVAKQEDSFLLRVQGVPLSQFVGRNAASISGRAVFLSAAERHLIEFHRDDLASGFEAALYDLVAKGPSVEQAIVKESLWSAQERSQRVARAVDAQRAVRWVYRERSLHSLLDSDRPFDFGDWSAVARVALCLRPERSTQANVVFGHLGRGDLDSAQSVAVDVFEGGYRDHSFLATRGMIEYALGRFSAAASFYEQAWQVRAAPRYLVPAVANHLVAHGTCPRELASELSTLGDDVLFHARELERTSHAPIHVSSRLSAYARLQDLKGSAATNELAALLEVLA